jgi:hypothetical protein
MKVEKILANEQVKDDKYRFALERGPLMYCIEGPDNLDSSVQNIVVDQHAAVSEVFKPALLNGVTVLEMKGTSTKRQLNSDELVHTTQTVTAIPYYAWANRGPSDMTVWIPYEASVAKPKPAATIASKAKVSASLRNQRMFKALNDQYEPADAKDNNAPYLHWWPKKNSLEWVQYDFDSPQTISSSSVYWYDDGPWGGCRIPVSWKLYYKKGEEWVEVKPTSTYSISKDKYDTVQFEPLTTTALKMEIQQPVEYSAGLHEWSVK